MTTTTLQVSRVELLDNPDPGLTCKLHHPDSGKGYQDHVFDVAGNITGEVEGWILVLSINGLVLTQAALSRNPSDGTFPFHLRASSLGLPASGDLDLCLFPDKTRILYLARIAYNRTPRQPAFKPAIQPALITALGRSGTTRFMQLLGRHPHIVAHNQYPYELRMAQYWLQVLHVLTAPASAHPKYTVDNFFNRPAFGFAGPCPYFHNPHTQDPFTEQWHNDQARSDIEHLCLHSIQRLYQKLAADQRKRRPRFYIEKFNPNFMPYLAREFYSGTREIFVVRDFRDMFASVLAFNRKRGAQGFGRNNVESDADYARVLSIGPIRNLCDAWRHRQDNTLLVKYEDLIVNPASTLKTILGHLNLSASEKVIDRMLFPASGDEQDYERHKTSANAESSIGKWKQSLSPELQTICNDLFHDALTLFDY